MKKIGILLLLVIFAGCEADPLECLNPGGAIVQKEAELPAFGKVEVFGHVNLFIEQGTEQHVRVEADENFINDVELKVVDGELQIREGSHCNFLREYGITKVFIVVPNLTTIRNSSAGTIESIGVLQFPQLSLISENQEKESEVYMSGVYRLHVSCENLRITNDNIAKYFLSGTTNYFRPGFYGGDGRLEAAELIAQEVDVFHRGSNKMIVNPQQLLSGEIRSTGDVIAVNRPTVVEVESFYTGRLIFQGE